MEHIEAAERLGWWLFAATALVVLGILAWLWKKGRSRTQRVIVLIPMLIHPGWWLSARGGDCGRGRILGSLIGLGLALIVPLIVLVVGRKHKNVPPAE